MYVITGINKENMQVFVCKHNYSPYFIRATISNEDHEATYHAREIRQHFDAYLASVEGNYHELRDIAIAEIQPFSTYQLSPVTLDEVDDLPSRYFPNTSKEPDHTDSTRRCIKLSMINGLYDVTPREVHLEPKFASMATLHSIDDDDDDVDDDDDDVDEDDPPAWFLELPQDRQKHILREQAKFRRYERECLADNLLATELKKIARVKCESSSFASQFEKLTDELFP